MLVCLFFSWILLVWKCENKTHKNSSRKLSCNFWNGDLRVEFVDLWCDDSTFSVAVGVVKEKDKKLSFVHRQRQTDRQIDK